LYGRGTSLRLAVASPTYETDTAGEVPYLDVVAVRDPEGRTVTFFAVNRHPDRGLATSISLEGFAPTRIVDHQVIADQDLTAVNILTQPDRITPRSGSGATLDGTTLDVMLPPHSWQMLRIAIDA
jgi:alpha-N-arabinofuranosidase